MEPADTVDHKALALRLEARWNDTRAAWERLKVKEAEAKDDIKARKSEIEAIQSAIDSIIREDHEDVRLAFKRIQDFRKKADKRIQSLDSATKRHKAEIEKRRAALEILLSSDMSQLPLLLPDMSVVTDLHVDGQLLIVGDPVEVKGVDDVRWFVRGFRTQGEGDERAEVVVLEDETGNELEADPEDLSRSEQELKTPKPKDDGEDAGPSEDPSTIFGGICIGDGVSHKTAGAVGRVVDYAKGSKRVVVVWEGSDTTPREVNPNNLEIVEKSSTKPTKRIAFKLGDTVSTADGRVGKIVAILTKASDRKPDGKMRTFPGKVQVQIEGEDEPSTFHARTLRRWKRPAK